MLNGERAKADTISSTTPAAPYNPGALRFPFLCSIRTTPSSGSTQAAEHRWSAQSTVAGEPFFPLRYFGTHWEFRSGRGGHGRRAVLGVGEPPVYLCRFKVERRMTGIWREKGVAIDWTGVERLKMTG